MSYTLSQAVQEVRYLINDPSENPFYDDVQIEGWIQQAASDISTKTLCTTDLDTLTLVNGQVAYTSSDSAWVDYLLKIKVAWYNYNTENMRAIQRIEPWHFGNVQYKSSGEPRFFCEDGKRIYIWPIPNADTDSTDLTIIYSKLTFDITELREEYQQLTFLFAASMAKAKDRKFEEASLYQQLYLNALNFERQDKYDMGFTPTINYKLP